MKSRVPKILFLCSFLPYLGILILGIVEGVDGALHGSRFLFSPANYGMDAFLNEFFFTILIFIFMFPVIPVCLFFQICYLFRAYIAPIKRIPLGAYIAICCVLGCIMIPVFLTLCTMMTVVLMNQ